MLAPSLLPLLLHSRGTPAQGMVPLTAGRSSYLNEQNQIIPLRHTQKLILQVGVDFVKLTINKDTEFAFDGMSKRSISHNLPWVSSRDLLFLARKPLSQVATEIPLVYMHVGRKICNVSFLFFFFMSSPKL